MTFFQLVENFNLQDVWRLKHPNEKEFTHFSDTKLSAGRIDAIWLSSNLILKTKKAEIQLRQISDHNPVTLELRNSRKLRWRWRMNENIFNNKKKLKAQEALK